MAPAFAEGDAVLRLAVEVARRDHPALDESKVRGEIARLAARYETLRGGSDEAAVRADAFRRLLFEAERFRSVADLTSSRTLHIDTVLAGRRGYCLSLSLVALAVAERVGAPLHGVAAPNHFFVRYDDGTFRRNLELTRAGATVTDAEYRRRARDRLPKESLYLRNLDPRALRAFLLHNRAYVALHAGRRKLARADLDAAIELAPGLGEAHRNLGVLLGERKQWAAARRSFARALAAYPGDVDALINMAICRHALGDLKAGLQDLEMALVLEPEHARARDLIDEWNAEHEGGTAHAAPPRPALPAPPAKLAPGLRAEFFAGTGFERVVATRVDRTLDFDWQNRSPAPKVPRDGFSSRWTGYFKAPRSATYTFFVAANDGCRLSVAGRKLIDNWRDMRWQNFYGAKEVKLEAGWHVIRIEHFDRRGGARLLLRIGVDGERDPLPLEKHLFHAPAPRLRRGEPDR